MVLLGGEPGIGKTRLASVLADDAEGRGIPVWWGRGWEDGSAPAFWPWNMALRRWIGQAGHQAIATAAGNWGGELAHVFPVLRERIPEMPASERWESDGARFRLFDLVACFLGAVAQAQGLVVVLDDVHWADRASLKLLEFIAADLTDRRVLVVATYRDNEVDRTDAFSDTLSRLVREPSTHRMRIGGLAPADCARWISLAGVRGDAALLGGMLHRETNGNPFFIGEIVHLLNSDEDHVGADSVAAPVPHGVHEVIARRLDRLGDECRATLSVAALFGDTIDAATLAHIVGGASVADHLERAARDRILVESEGRSGQYTFAHGLIRRVLIDGIQPSQRAIWHARIAAVLERHATTFEVGTMELVRHLAAIGSADALRRAFDYACMGAEQAARGLGWEEAARFYEIALEVGCAAGLLAAGRAVHLRLARARALRGAGDVAAARTVCEQVMTACRRLNDPESFARAALIHAGPIPEWGRVEPPVRAVLEEASRHGPVLDDALKARLYARLAGDIIAANEVKQGERVFSLCDEAAAAARRAAAPGALAVALMGTYYAAAMGMRRAECGRDVPSSQEMLAAAEAGGEHEYAAAIRYSRAMTLLSIGEPEAFSSEVDALATTAATLRVAEALWLADALTALRATIQGRFHEAQHAMDRALATGRRAQLPNAVGVHASQRILWHLAQGRLAEIVAEVDAFANDHPGGRGWQPFRALARLAGGDVVAARAEFHSLLASGLAPAERGVMARTYLAGLAALCVALHEREHAPALYERIARRHDRWSIDGCHTFGPWALLLGGLARLCERPADAVAHFEDAIRLGRHMGSPVVVARAQSMLASLQLSRDPNAAERQSISAMLAEAGQSAQGLGLVDVSARVARLQAKLAGGQVDRPRNAFRCDGDVWAVSFAGRDLRLKDGKGPRYLATLLAAPGREIHVLQFGGAAASTSAVASDGLSIGQLGGGLDDAPDRRACDAYRGRVVELRAELDEAEQCGDHGRAEGLRAELDSLVAQLAQRFGSHTRTRSPAETARKAVTKVLREQIVKLADLHPALAGHLRETLRMGKVCVYAPATPVAWDVGLPT